MQEGGGTGQGEGEGQRARLEGLAEREAFPSIPHDQGRVSWGWDMTGMGEAGGGPAVVSRGRGSASRSSPRRWENAAWGRGAFLFLSA